jgi:hypothetical protein
VRALYALPTSLKPSIPLILFIIFMMSRCWRLLKNRAKGAG